MQIGNCTSTFSLKNYIKRYIIIPKYFFQIIIKVIAQTGTLFIALFVQNMEHSSLLMIPSKTISICI